MTIPRTLAVLGATTVGWLATQARRIAHARRLAARPVEAFHRIQDQAHAHVLVVGDSTGAGVGCESPQATIAGRLAREHGQVSVENLSHSGATVAQVLDVVRAQPRTTRRADLALVFAGGNDILGRTPDAQLERQAWALAQELRTRARHVLWIGIANVGLAPAFLPPLSWWLSRRARRLNALLGRVAARCGIGFVDFYRSRGSDVFSAEPQRFYAEDGVHPSAQAHAWCYAQLRPRLAQALPRPEA